MPTEQELFLEKQRLKADKPVLKQQSEKEKAARAEREKNKLLVRSELTTREKRLLADMRELLSHIAVKDALGDVSLKFCRGCDKNHRGVCPVERINRQLVNLYEE